LWALLCLGHIISVTVYRQGVRNRLFGTERYSVRYKLCYRTGTICITNCATERYSLHYKLCYRTCTVCITNCATEQVQSALPQVQHSGHMLYKDVVQLVLIVDFLVTPVQEVLPLASHLLQTEPHISTVSVMRCGRPKSCFRISELELN